MSILIKGMKMPKGCRDCKLLDFYEDRYRCPFIDYLRWEHYDEVPDFIISEHCPLVEVPTPHGRLIDAEVVNSALKKRLLAVDTAPTVIEAEGQEHGCGKSEEEKE